MISALALLSSAAFAQFKPCAITGSPLTITQINVTSSTNVLLSSQSAANNWAGGAVPSFSYGQSYNMRVAYTSSSAFTINSASAYLNTFDLDNAITVLGVTAKTFSDSGMSFLNSISEILITGCFFRCSLQYCFHERI